MASEPSNPKGKARSKVCGTPPSKSTKVTPKEHRFCILFVETGKKAKSYQEAFQNYKTSPAVLWRRAERLLSYPKIQNQIQELRDRIMAKHDVTVDSLVEELEEARKAALSADTPQAGAAVSATMGKAKLCGLDSQKVEVSGPGGSAFFPSRIELVAPDVSSKS